MKRSHTQDAQPSTSNQNSNQTASTQEVGGVLDLVALILDKKYERFIPNRFGESLNHLLTKEPDGEKRFYIDVIQKIVETLRLTFPKLRAGQSYGSYYRTELNDNQRKLVDLLHFKTLIVGAEKAVAARLMQSNKIDEDFTDYDSSDSQSTPSDTMITNCRRIDEMKELMTEFFKENPDVSKKITDDSTQDYVSNDLFCKIFNAGNSDFHAFAVMYTAALLIATDILDFKNDMYQKSYFENFSLGLFTGKKAPEYDSDDSSSIASDASDEDFDHFWVCIYNKALSIQETPCSKVNLDFYHQEYALDAFRLRTYINFKKSDQTYKAPPIQSQYRRAEFIETFRDYLLEQKRNRVSSISKDTFKSYLKMKQNDQIYKATPTQLDTAQNSMHNDYVAQGGQAEFLGTFRVYMIELTGAPSVSIKELANNASKFLRDSHEIRTKCISYIRSKILNLQTTTASNAKTPPSTSKEQKHLKELTVTRILPYLEEESRLLELYVDPAPAEINQNLSKKSKPENK